MSKFNVDELTEAQKAKLEEAAYRVLMAHQEAEASLREAGIEFPPEDSPFASHCAGVFPPPPLNHHCGCNGYRGDGGPCIRLVVDTSLPDFGGTELPRRRCGHLPSQHWIAP